VQYDSGKATPSGFERTRSLNIPPTVLLNTVANLHAAAVAAAYNCHRLFSCESTSSQKPLMTRHRKLFSRPAASISTQEHSAEIGADLISFRRAPYRLVTRCDRAVVHYYILPSRLPWQLRTFGYISTKITAVYSRSLLDRIKCARSHSIAVQSI
jgi:hypothetical protein